VRATTLLKKILPFTRLILNQVRQTDDGSIVVEAAIRGRPRCATCGIKRPIHESSSEPVRWRHLDLGCQRLYIKATTRRVSCRKCGTIAVEQIPWAPPGSRFTYHFEDVVAWLAKRTDKTATREMMGIDWKTVGRIIERVVSRRRDPVDLTNLRAISVDEISYRKGHHYLTLVVDIEKGRVIWGKEGKSSETLEAFFDEVGEESCAKIEHCAIDMGAAYIKAVEAKLPHATLVFDRFHVQSLVSDAVDEVRREQWRGTARGSDERKELRHARYSLLKNPWNLTPKQQDALATLQASNKSIYRAYLLKESFADIFRHLFTVDTARKKFKAWTSWASRSRLEPFVRVARTVRKHFAGILAYFETGYTTSMSEGFNNKARLATRRAYGFHSAEAFLAMIELTCPGIPVPLPRGASS
jgi:transposase